MNRIALALLTALFPFVLQAQPPDPPKSRPSPPLSPSTRPTPDAPPLYSLDSPTPALPPQGSSLARIFQTQILRVCVRSDIPPFGYFHEQTLTGFDLELAKLLALHLSATYKRNLSLSWVVVSARGRLQALQKQRCDLVLAAFSNTPERQAKIAFSSVYLQIEKVLVGRKKILRPTPILAAVQGATFDPALPARLKAKVRVFRSYAAILAAMEQGEVDYLLTDSPIASHLIRSAGQDFTILQKTGKTEEYAIGLPLSQPALKEAIDRSLRFLAHSGFLAYLQRQWL